MCQIHLILDKKNKKLKKEDREELEKLMCFGAIDNNDDGFGIFNSKEIYKRDGEFNPKYIDRINIEEDSFIIGHNRHSTNKFDKYKEERMPIIRSILKGKFPKKIKSIVENYEKIRHEQSHPFKIENLVLVHNGVIFNDAEIRKKNKIDSIIKTDSYVILYLIDKYMKLSRANTRRRRIVEAIENTCQDICGWYSCFLYDAEEDNLMYFKLNANFYILESENKLIGSTNKKNLKYVYKGMKKEKIRIEDSIIYQIRNGEVKEIKKMKDDLIVKLSRLMKGGLFIL